MILFSFDPQCLDSMFVFLTFHFGFSLCFVDSIGLPSGFACVCICIVSDLDFLCWICSLALILFLDYLHYTDLHLQELCLSDPDWVYQRLNLPHFGVWAWFLARNLWHLNPWIHLCNQKQLRSQLSNYFWSYKMGGLCVKRNVILHCSPNVRSSIFLANVTLKIKLFFLALLQAATVMLLWLHMLIKFWSK